MCQMKSVIIEKDSIFCPDYDSHTKMLEELGIEDSRGNAEKLFVRAELYPINGNVFTPINEWIYRVDQDILPEWYVEKYDEERVRKTVKKWAEQHIHIGKGNLEISSGKNHYIKDCKNVLICDSAAVKYICGSTTVNNICDSATVNNICDSATVKYICGDATVKCICGNATVKYICGDATVKYICGNATVENIYGNATVEKAFGLSTVIGSPYGWANKSKLILCENATFKDCETKTIWQSGGWKLCKYKGVID